MQKKKKKSRSKAKQDTVQKIKVGDLVKFNFPRTYTCFDSFGYSFQVSINPGDTGIVLNHRKEDRWTSLVLEATSEVLIGKLIVADIPDCDLHILRTHV